MVWEWEAFFLLASTIVVCLSPNHIINCQILVYCRIWYISHIWIFPKWPYCFWRSRLSLSKPNLSWSLSPLKSPLSNFFLITLCLFLLPAKHTHYNLQPCSSQPLNHGPCSFALFYIYNFVYLHTVTTPAQIYMQSLLCMVVSDHKNDCGSKNYAKQSYQREEITIVLGPLHIFCQHIKNFYCRLKTYRRI